MGAVSCPVCGTVNPHSTVRCGKYKGHICMKHCYEGCEFHFNTETSVVHCFYLDRQKEKKKLLELQQKQSQE